MSDQPHYPHADGDRAVLGPDVYATADGMVIFWQGAKYRRDYGPAAPTEAVSARVSAPQANGGAAEGRDGERGFGGRETLRERLAEALMRWAEGNNSPQYASMRRPETVRQNAYSRADAVLAVVQPELDQLDALRAVARGYCPSCGRGDAAPTVEDWEAERQRADKAEQLLRRYVDLAAVTHKYPIQGGHDCLGENLACAGCALAEQAEKLLEQRAALQPAAPAHDTGPTVREAAADDAAHWNDKYAGEER